MHDNKPRPLPPISQSDLARFEKYRNTDPGHGPNGDCHVFTAAKCRNGEFGYGIFGIFCDGKLRTVKAHRVAWFIETGEDPYPLSVLHRCDFPPCIRGSHLFLGTTQDNSIDREMKGRGFSWFKAHPEIRKRGEDHHMVSVSDAELMEMCQWRKDGMILREIAERKGMSVSGVYSAINKWRDLSNKPEQKDRKHGENHPMAKLSNDQCREVKRLSEQGVPQKKIAALFGVESIVGVPRRHWTMQEKRIVIFLTARWGHCRQKRRTSILDQLNKGCEC